MKREELLTDAMLFFSPNERSITVENGARYYREDVVLKAMELAGKETPLPPAEGAEEILHKYVHTINSDGTSLVTFMGALKAMREFAAQQKPTSSATAEEILQKYMDMSMIICPLHVVPRTVALDAMTEFAALHAQKIADMMVDDNTAELRSLKQTIIESGLLKFAPKHEMSFHDKVVFAIAELKDASDKMVSERLREKGKIEDCGYWETYGYCIPGCGTDSCKHHPNNR